MTCPTYNFFIISPPRKRRHRHFNILEHRVDQMYTTFNTDEIEMRCGNVIRKTLLISMENKI